MVQPMAAALQLLTSAPAAQGAVGLGRLQRQLLGQLLAALVMVLWHLQRLQRLQPHLQPRSHMQQRQQQEAGGSAPVQIPAHV